MHSKKFKAPAPETFISEHPETGAKLYAELAEVPIYVNARLVCAPGALGVGRRRSFRVGWIIGEQRLARGADALRLAKDVTRWISTQLADVYPDHETASGLTPEEVAELEAEQKAKRNKHKK